MRIYKTIKNYSYLEPISYNSKVKNPTFITIIDRDSYNFYYFNNIWHTYYTTNATVRSRIDHFVVEVEEIGKFAKIEDSYVLWYDEPCLYL